MDMHHLGEGNIGRDKQLDRTVWRGREREKQIIINNLLRRKSETTDSLSAWGRCIGAWLGSSPFLQQPTREQKLVLICTII